jgi:hypothetical protein
VEKALIGVELDHSAAPTLYVVVLTRILRRRLVIATKPRGCRFR